MVSVQLLSSLAVLLAGANAQDIPGIFSSLSVALDDTYQAVSSWQSSAGLAGALAVQSKFEAVNSPLSAVVSAAQAADGNDAAVVSQISNGVGSITTPAVNLLNALVEKAADLQSLGAGTIVQNDLNQVGPQVFSLENVIYSKIPSTADAAVVTPAFQSAESINAALSSAASAFSANIGQAPTTPTLGGGGGASSAPAETSAAPQSSAPPAETSAPSVETSAPPASSAAATPGKCRAKVTSEVYTAL